MKTRKLPHLLLILLCLTALLSGCGEKPEPEISEPEETEAVEPANTVDTADLLNTLKWLDENNLIAEFKNECVTGYEQTIGDTFDHEPDGTESAEKEDKELPYNILQWKYAEHDTTEYLLLEYNYEDANYKVLFYKDVLGHVNIAELYVNLEQWDSTNIKSWADSVFIPEEPGDDEPDDEEVTEAADPEPEPEPPAEKSEGEKLAEEASGFVSGKRFHVAGTERVVEFSPSGQFICHGYYGSDPVLGDEANLYTAYSFSAREELHKDYMQYLTYVTIDGVEYYFRYFTDGRISLEGNGEFSDWYEPY